MTETYRAKKRYGQHFLHERKFIDDILKAAQLTGTSRVLEIGPGLGALTDPLLLCGVHLLVMEVDRDIVARFRQRTEPNLQVHEGDALRLDWRSILCEPPYTLISNLPYNISSQILFRLLDERDLFIRAVLMFQKEVADRIVARPGSRNYGILSVLSQLYFDVRRVVAVPSGAFTPAPKVDSAVIELIPLAAPRYPMEDELFLRRVVKAAFAQRRKTLRNSLRTAGFSAEEIASAAEVVGIDLTRRGETLALNEFTSLADTLLAQGAGRPDQEDKPTKKGSFYE
ncbi:MAG: 16S rRNA (adenine(1518)-N(6)/adenine(1519)-N(6))-dimethyltransferase RsmA [Desulfuromonadales bacterium]|nr:16S rRNA (adenine(1518)-N(6)/adenine(1519)-N(6))-dimethyltransferase RsmA [Desulfuromonadales bacterium]